MIETSLVDNVDISHCQKCTATKVNNDLDCSAYGKTGQARWMRLGWCPLGNVGSIPPKDHVQRKKVRAGQQKQART